MPAISPAKFVHVYRTRRFDAMLAWYMAAG
jgi:hypothetical protein